MTERDDAARGRVVVGVDGSDSSIQALTWALEVATVGGRTIHVVTAWPDPGEVFIHEVPGHFCEPRARAVLAQHEAVDAALARVVHRPAAINLEVANARPVEAMLALARRGDLLVVGAPRPTTLPRHRDGVGETCSLLAPCPVVVVEPTATPVG
ncbi:nucleotide-binding universal stress UspA family protein [Nocardioides ginsengisegetis]|uniref:Nucleotide-binding universal stress UspA family protein n=1 Tax=Nocardioides ginsengisegetis TaxID=661491 RepID=A0A7W3IZI0_9ACTN|nr:universal stress protein [Nocardioides ginsengisegetis]MBA8803450.1 nucleotide-binding universal stress UspA family protein [Nocardioides ginsengisegetis]